MKETLQEQNIPTREQIIERLLADLEIQRISTELQELRTRHVSARYNEIKFSDLLYQMTRQIEEPTKEEIEELKKQTEEKK